MNYLEEFTNREKNGPGYTPAKHGVPKAEPPIEGEGFDGYSTRILHVSWPKECELPVLYICDEDGNEHFRGALTVPNAGRADLNIILPTDQQMTFRAQTFGCKLVEKTTADEQVYISLYEDNEFFTTSNRRFKTGGGCGGSTSSDDNPFTTGSGYTVCNTTPPKAPPGPTGRGVR